jgi:hypothetical protein
MPSFWDILPANYWAATQETLLPSYAPTAREAAAQLSSQRTNKPDAMSMAFELAGGPMLGAAVKPMLQAAKPGIRAYHGSPYDFDKFDLSKIGTGEGAQAYGHGLYFAENPSVALDYRNRLNPGFVSKVGGFEYDSSIPEHLAAHYVDMFSKRGKSSAEIANILDEEGMTAAHRKAADLIRGGKKLPAYERDPAGRMYEVNINAHPDQFLDWDKPLSGQAIAGNLPGSFLDAAKQEAYHRAIASTSKPRADQLWSMVKDPIQAPGGFAVNAAKNSPQLSSELKDLGIPGIKYFDQGSRMAGEGSSNYVVFDDKIIDILKKYGIAGMGMIGMGGAVANQPQPVLGMD